MSHDASDTFQVRQKLRKKRVIMEAMVNFVVLRTEKKIFRQVPKDKQENPYSENTFGK